MNMVLADGPPGGRPSGVRSSPARTRRVAPTIWLLYSLAIGQASERSLGEVSRPDHGGRAESVTAAMMEAYVGVRRLRLFRAAASMKDGLDRGHDASHMGVTKPFRDRGYGLGARHRPFDRELTMIEQSPRGGEGNETVRRENKVFSSIRTSSPRTARACYMQETWRIVEGTPANSSPSLPLKIPPSTARKLR
jgi:hypothetical protein